MSAKLLVSPRRKSPEKKSINTDLVIPPAKRNFLTSAENTLNKTVPLKRHTTPIPSTPEKVPQEENELALLSPVDLKKIGIGSPPQRPKVSWKTRWQGSTQTVNGVSSEKGKKKRKLDEASKLLDDEGVIQMLNRVPSVHGVMPKPDPNSSARVQRARSAAPKQKVQKKIHKKKVDITVINKKLNKEDLKQVIKLETVKEPEEPRVISGPNKMPLTEMGGSTPVKVEPGVPGESFLSPKRAARKEGNFELEENLSLIRRTDDCFVHLTELPSEQLELLMNCDIRFSLPKQGAPLKEKIPSTQLTAGPTAKPKESSSSFVPRRPPSVADKPKPPPPQAPISPKFQHSGGQLSLINGVASGSTQAALYKLPPLPTPDQQGEVEDRLQELLQHCQGETDQSKQPSNLIPGQYNQIYVRFYESFAQVTLASSRTKLKGSLNPSMIDELVHILHYAAESKRVRGLLINGVGGIFCQGVDLTFLSADSQVERRRNNAAQLAAAVERLVLALVNFPKLLVAAVNGSAIGLGLTILPLFDIVYANDKATFSTFYSRLGQIPEGAASVNLTRMRGGALAEMLLTGRSLTAEQMKDEGIVSQIFFPGRLMEEAIPRMRKACAESNPGLHWNKLLLKQNQKNQVEQVISGETELLKEIWSSKEFHVNLVKFINTEKCLQFQKPTS